mmetsp:Transcript_12964/g.15583  ORF Transcript_12964/g.15583 Transcript_12964/m.15583 type:complete len:160 (-) Transcript_12964:250-729(-)
MFLVKASQYLLFISIVTSVWIGLSTLFLESPESSDPRQAIQRSLSITFTSIVVISGMVIGELRRWTAVSVLGVQVFATILTFAGVYKAYGLVGLGCNEATYADAFYFSIVTFTTLGYGDLQPIEQIRLIAAYQALLGYLFLGMLVGLVAGAFGKSQTLP